MNALWRRPAIRFAFLSILLFPGNIPLVAQEPVSETGILVEIGESGIPVKNEWPAESVRATETYRAPAFAFFRAPHKYIDTGIRADRANPFLLRASGTVALPAGKHRFLLRGRGASRLAVDGKLVLETPFPPPISDGHNAIPTDYLDLGPDFRFAPPGNRETWGYFVSRGQSHQVVLETIVGGMSGTQSRRPELGETVVAIALEGSEVFRVVAPALVIPYTDEGWKAFAEDENRRIGQIEARRRQTAFGEYADVWQKRRDAARLWIASTTGPEIPKLPAGFPVHNAIDHFLADKLASTRKEASRTKATIDFAKHIRPILEAKCFACHQGSKVKGGLRLDSAQGAAAGGDSGEPALTPSRPEQSLLVRRVMSTVDGEVMPPKGERLTGEEKKLIEQWVREGASWQERFAARTLSPRTDDLSFLRRVTLDTVGVVPTPKEIQDFLTDRRADKRDRAIDRLLSDPRWADHWVSYWQDVLAENPNILNPTLNNTGPYRFWIHEALLDNKPMDVFVTELVRMRGSHYLGGPAGFAMASENDVPMAEKAAIVGSAFLGVQMKCARCHDAPGHKTTQKDLFQLAALLAQKPIVVPPTSSVPKDKLHGQGRPALITVTLAAGTKIAPAWPFAEFAGHDPGAGSDRDRLAALLTDPRNERFAQVLANRVWKRFMGRGLVEPVDDWEKGVPTHPELLRYLARELVRSGYDLKQLGRLILTTHAYQRATDPELAEPDPLYAVAARRRLSAEQIVDSLYLAAGKALDTEEVSLDVDGRRDVKNSISLGKPRRAWQFASTSNERDRPSLSLPKVQAVVDVLEAFGWRPSRQFPLTDRELAPNVLQPAILANGTMSGWLTRLSDDHAVTHLALQEQTPEALVDHLYLRVLTRTPTPEERRRLSDHIRPGFAERIVSLAADDAPAEKRVPAKYVSWSNHLTGEATEIKLRLETAARRGAPPTQRLDSRWRERLEDVLWTVLNAPEMAYSR